MSTTLSKTDKATRLAIIFTSGGAAQLGIKAQMTFMSLAHRAARGFKRDWNTRF